MNKRQEKKRRKKMKIKNELKKTVFIWLLLINTFLLSILTPITLYRKNGTKINNNTSPLTSAGCSLISEWNKTWGGIETDRSYALALDPIGNFYLAGSTWSYGAGWTDLALVKYNNSGDLQWNRTWGGVVHDGANSIELDESGNIYVAGSSGENFADLYGDVLLLKYNNVGELQWNKTWGGNQRDGGDGIVIDSLGDIYVAVTTQSFGAGQHDIGLLKYNNSGDLQWNRTWGGSAMDWSTGIAIDSSDNVYIAGTTDSFGDGNGDLCLLKYNSSGDLQWSRNWGLGAGEYSRGITLDELGNIYLTGITDNTRNLFILKYNPLGVLSWSRTHSIGAPYDLFDIELDSSNNIFLAGYKEVNGYRDMFLINYDNAGNFICDLTWGGNFGDEASALAIDSSDNIFISGSTNSYGAGQSDMILVKLIIGEPSEPSEPSGKSTYLGPGQSVILHFSVKGGDVVKGEYSTDPHLSLIIAWGYGGNNGIMAQDTSRGTFTLNILDGSGDCVFTFTNLDTHGGILQYNVYVVSSDSDSIPSFNLSIIITVSIVNCILLLRRKYRTKTVRFL